MNIAKKIDYKGHTIEIVYEECCESPREWDNLGTIYTNHRDYNPDGHKIDELGEDAEAINETLKGYYWLPIYAYIHSGITISTSNRTYPYNDSWDSGLFGIIAVSKDAPEAKTMTEEQVLEVLRGEIEVLDDYYQGHCYGFRITNRYGEEVDSCWGFIGKHAIDEDIMPEARSVIDTIVAMEEKAEKKSGKVTITIEAEYLYTKKGKTELTEEMIKETVAHLVAKPNFNTRENGVELVTCDIRV